MSTVEAGTVYFIGAGPGALDLLTVRAQRIIQQADLILYADSLVNPEIAKLAKAGAQVRGTSDLALDEIVEQMVTAVRMGQAVVRVHSGDPSVFGAIHEQMAALEATGVGYRIVPGVSSLFGAAAVLGVELTVPEVTQTVIIGRAEGRTPVPEREALASLAAHGATMAIFLSAALIENVVSQLLAGGYSAETPAAVVYRATWPDQRIIRSSLGQIADAVSSAGINRQALILVGDAFGPRKPNVSRLYDPAFGHGCRATRGALGG